MDNETKSEITQLFSSIMVLIRYQKVYWDKTISTGGIEMFVQDDLSIKSMTVSQIYDLFLNGRLIVIKGNFAGALRKSEILWIQ